MKRMKKLFTAFMAMALVFGICRTPVLAADDFVLDGGGGDSTFVKTIQGNGSNYNYNGFVTTDGAATDYKYLQFTYTGDITYLRLEFENMDGKLTGPYWFTSDQSIHFTSADGKDFVTVADAATTITVDLAASGVDLGTVGNKGFHLHYGADAQTDGTATVTDARLTNNGPAGAEAGTTEEKKDTPAATDTTANTDTATKTDTAAKTGSSTVPTAIACIVALGAGTVLLCTKKKKA